MNDVQTAEPVQDAVVVCSLEAITREVSLLVGIGYRASQRIAVLVSMAKDQHFETVPEWLSWAHSQFCYARRSAFQLARVGGFLRATCSVSPVVSSEMLGSESDDAMHLLLPSASNDALPKTARSASGSEATLLACDLEKLGILASLHEAKPDQFAGLLAHWNPAEHSRDEVRAKVRAFLGEEVHTLTCADCQEEFESTDAKAKRCSRCDIAAKAEREKRIAERQKHQLEGKLTELAALCDRAELVDEEAIRFIGPGIAFRAGLTCLGIGCRHVAEVGDTDRETVIGFVDQVQEALDAMRELAMGCSE